MGKKAPRRRAPAPEPNGADGTPKGLPSGTPPEGVAQPGTQLDLHVDAKKARALVAFRTYSVVKHACEAVGIGRTTWYRWIEEDPAFGELVAHAEEEVTDELETRAYDRATAAKEPSDRLIIFLLKARRRQKYGDRTELTLVSPDVKDRLQRTVKLVGSRQVWKSAELMTLLHQVWQ